MRRSSFVALFFVISLFAPLAGCRSGGLVELCGPATGGCDGGLPPVDLQPPPVIPDFAPPDFAVAPDFSLRDFGLPDFALTSDFAVAPDLAIRDFAMPDFTVAPDLAIRDFAAPDFTVAPDLATHDLVIRDLAPADLLVTRDLANPDAFVPPPACTQGADPFTASRWVVCAADANSAWLSMDVGMGGRYHTLQICNQLGYSQVGQQGGTCSSVCGFCEGASPSCMKPGKRFFDGAPGGCQPDQFGPVFCTTVMWECLK